MSVTVSCLLESKAIESTQTTQYTSVNQKTIIDKCTVKNNDTVVRTIDIGIVRLAGTAGAASSTVFKSLQPNETYTFPEIVGHILEAGDYISTLGQVAGMLIMRISGRSVS